MAPIHQPSAVAPCGLMLPTAACAAARACGVICSRRKDVGYTIVGSVRPAMTANQVPSRMLLSAVTPARRAAAILAGGMSMEPEASMMSTSAAAPP